MSNILDIGIYETGTGGDINIVNDDIETIQSLANQVYLALFGGNVEQSTSEIVQGSERLDYWGNEYLDIEQQFNSTFERALTQVALTSSGISKLEDAAKKDLKYLSNYADVSISGSIPDISKFRLEIILKQPSDESLKVVFVWDGNKNEVIEQRII
jgi:phage gp46-like protein